MLHDEINFCEKNFTNPDDVILSTLWAWRQLPKSLMRFSWTSRGLVSLEKMAELNGISVESMVVDKDEVDALHKKYIILTELPQVHPNRALAEPAPENMPNKRIWLVSTASPPSPHDVNESEWAGLPDYIGHILQWACFHYRGGVEKAVSALDAAERAGVAKAIATQRKKLSEAEGAYDFTVVVDSTTKKDPDSHINTYIHTYIYIYIYIYI